jgi:uncharacterized protein
MLELATVTLASLFAGLIDAIVGGGGLILVPALFSVFPNAAPATLFGTNKAAAVWGTAWATAQYARRVQLQWSALLPAAIAALAGSFAGAWTVTLVNANGLRKALPFILTVVLIYTLARKDMGRTHAPRHTGTTQAVVASAIGVVIGFYDGFFSPGAVRLQRPRLVAHRRRDGRGQCGGQFARHPLGLEARRGFCALGVHCGGERVDFEDGV